MYSPQRTKTDSNRRAHQGGSSFQDWRITTLLLMQFASCFSRGDWQPQESFVWPQGLYSRSSNADMRSRTAVRAFQTPEDTVTLYPQNVFYRRFGAVKRPLFSVVLCFLGVAEERF